MGAEHLAKTRLRTAGRRITGEDDQVWSAHSSATFEAEVAPGFATEQCRLFTVRSGTSESVISVPGPRSARPTLHPRPTLHQ